VHFRLLDFPIRASGKKGGCMSFPQKDIVLLLTAAAAASICAGAVVIAPLVFATALSSMAATGDGVVNATDMNLVRTRLGTSQP
jgi:hypothetical protein